jgi:hypothetical protein
VLWRNLNERGRREEKYTYSNAQFLSQCVHFRMFQQLCTVLVDRGCRGVGRETAVGEFGGEVFARVEVLEKAAHGL